MSWKPGCLYFEKKNEVVMVCANSVSSQLLGRWLPTEPHQALRIARARTTSTPRAPCMDTSTQDSASRAHLGRRAKWIGCICIVQRPRLMRMLRVLITLFSLNLDIVMNNSTVCIYSSALFSLLVLHSIMKIYLWATCKYLSPQISRAITCCKCKAKQTPEW